MRVAELMKKPVVTVGMEATVQDAVNLLADDHVSALPVTDTAGRIVGVLSVSDILVAESETDDETARQALFSATPVRDLMSVRPLMVSPEAEVREAAQQMLYADVHRLFVASEERVIGVISTSDIARAVAQGLV
jgi:CBS domain-containing protein